MGAAMPLPQVSQSLESKIQGMMLASQRLPATSRSLFDKVFLRGEAPAAVCQDLGMTPVQFEQQRAAILRSLMMATH